MRDADQNLPVVDSGTVHWLFELEKEYRRSDSRARLFLAEAAVNKLGPLSPWWLDPDAIGLVAACRGGPIYEGYLRTAQQPTPEPGLSLVVCKWQDGGREAGAGEPALLRPAAVFPLRWIRSAGDDAALPAGLREMADAVRSAVSSLMPAGQQFGLRWGLPRSAKIQARDLPVNPPSAFFPLAASLVLAGHSDHATPNVRVWSTGAWDVELQELKPVDGIAEKIAAMAQFGADAIFVPAQNYNDARAAARRVSLQDRVHALEPVGHLGKVLRPILTRLRVPPGEDASFEELCEYDSYLFRYDRNERQAFYRKRLVPHVIERCKQQLSEELRRIAAARPWLVTVASHNYELVQIAYKVFDCSGLVLVTTTADSKEPARSALASLGLWRIDAYERIQVGEISELSEGVEQVQQVYARAVELAAGRPIIVDLTPGPKWLTLALIQARPREAALVYMTHDWYRIGDIFGPKPGTERYQPVMLDALHPC